MKNIKLFSVLFIICLFVSGCCCLGKPPCFSCGDKSSFNQRHFKGSECPFAGCFMKASFCALKNKEKLSLTSEQENKIKELCNKSKKGAIDLKAEVKKVEVDLRTKLQEDFDKDAINSLIDKKIELKKQLIKSAVNSHAELLAILTPEQNEKFKAIMRECRKNGCGYKGDCCGKGCS
ncbi:MAG: hypothetical protein A3B68_02010 [Candidatus Melainabacteria bacterium RIFCSPHIGHO2_02_FULL_34_12]|nr:MAG: hypothetical protein A3B68_02010 [Candidatus Melainabacteria bacterium RIFCSPHIGHO2_02_FULL_34_12]